MKKIISIAIVSLMAFSMAFGASAMVNSDGTTPSAASGMMTIMTTTTQAPETKDASSGTGATTASGATAPDQEAAAVTATASEGATTSTDVEELKRTVEATDGTAVTTNEDTATDELMYTTGIGAEEQDHTLLYTLSIIGAVLLVGVPISMKLLKKAD